MPKHVTRLVLFLVTIIFCSPLAAQDWRGRGSVRGQVVDDLGKPLEGVEIEARIDIEGDTLRTISTNKRGSFILSGVRPGAWILHLEPTGFEPVEQGVEAVRVRAGEPVIIQLTKLPDQAFAAIDVDEANQLFLAEDWPGARVAYQRALARLSDTQQVPVLVGIARTYLNENNSGAAQETLHKALSIDPQSLQVGQLLAAAMSADGDIEGAEQLLAQFDSIEPDFNTLVGIGVSRFNEGDTVSAREYFDRAIAADSEAPYPYYYRGLCNLTEENNQAALVDFERFLVLDPEAEERAEVESYVEFLKQSTEEG